MQIKVTQEDIDNGIKCSSDSCPVARAISRKMDKPYRVGRMFYWPTYAPNVRDAMLLLPEEAQKFINFFDFGPREHIKPFEFEL